MHGKVSGDGHGLKTVSNLSIVARSEIDTRTFLHR